MLARDAILKKNYPEAHTQLQWVLKHSKDPSIREIARLRIARLLIAENKAQTALELLKKIDDKNFIGLIDEIRGDAYLSINDPKAARAAYQQALNELPNAEVTRPILQMKYDNLAT
jgi:predicted negative regulator of RcsB-dependent stress response